MQQFNVREPRSEACKEQCDKCVNIFEAVSAQSVHTRAQCPSNASAQRDAVWQAATTAPEHDKRKTIIFACNEHLEVWP